MTLELNYDRSLHEKEHRAGPFEITAEMIGAVNSSLGEGGPAFTSDAGARDLGYRGMIAPPTLCSIYVREVQLPDVAWTSAKSRCTQASGSAHRPGLRRGYADGLFPPERGLRQDWPVRDHGLCRLGDHFPQPARRSCRGSAGVLRPPGVNGSFRCCRSDMLSDQSY